MRVIHRWQENYPHKGPVTRKMLPFGDIIKKSTLDQLMAWCRQLTNPLLEPVLTQITIAIWRHLGTTPLTDMSKLVCATSDIDICMTVFNLSINDSMTQIIWRTVVEIRDDYKKSVLVQVVDWCRQAASNYLSQRRQNLAIRLQQATLWYNDAM